MKLFVSYRSSDSDRVDSIVTRLRSLKDDHNQPRYSVWQDKDGIPPGKDWWQAIVDAVIDCDVFIFMVSHESVQNINCRAELSYARRRNRAIIPIVLEHEFTYNTTTGKNDIDYWNHVPEELLDARAQFLFYEGVSFVKRLETALDHIRRNPPRDMPAPRPPDPRPAAEANRDTTVLYDEACDYAFRLELGTAERFFQRLVNANDPDFGQEAYEWIVILRDYDQMMRWDASTNTRHKVRAKWETYVQQFPKPFTPLFDPKNLRERYVNNESLVARIEFVAPPVSAEPQLVANPDMPDWLEEVVAPSVSTEPQPVATLEMPDWLMEIDEIFSKGPQVATTPSHSRSVDLLPAPFAWVEIPGKGYSIAKYPVTNAQFRLFVEAGGYREGKWWTDAGWVQRVKDGWREPRYWQDKKWNGAEQPAVGVAWYESVAFCLWLSDVTGEKIMLPTEDQWQYAAQGDDGRDFPWGKQWDCKKCNNSVKPCDNNRTTPVRQYEGKGNSPFGVVDMTGNVWEWCLTEYDDQKNDLNSNTYRRVLRGSSWYGYNSDFFRCDFRDGDFPHFSNFNVGFRLVRS